MPQFHIKNGFKQGEAALTMIEVTLRPRRNTKVPNRRMAMLQPRDFPGSSIGVVLANMNKVAGRRSSIVAALYGGLSVLPQDMDDNTLRRIITAIKTANTWCEPAITLKPTDKILEATALIKKMSHGMIVVIDVDGKPVGVLSESDYWDEKKKEYKRSEHDPVSTVMRRDVQALQLPNFAEIGRDESYAKAFYQLYDWNKDAAPVVDSSGTLVGVMTRFFAGTHSRSKSKPLLPPIIQHPSLDAQGRLMVGVAIGINQDAVVKAKLVLELGADVLVLDTAHGHSDMMIDCIRRVRAAVGPDVIIVAGNACTAEGVCDLMQAGANIVKVGVGPGAVCTTRVTTGHGCPQLDAVLECAAAAAEIGGFVWADGGIKEPGDVVKLEAAGATRCMIGSMAAGVYESPGSVKIDDRGREYKDNAGMAALASVVSRNANGDDPLETFIRSHYVEGVSGRSYIHPDRPHLGALLVWFTTGHQSGRSYSNALTQQEMYDVGTFMVQGPASRNEGLPNGTNMNR